MAIKRKTRGFTAVIAGVALLFAACSTESEPPEGLAFQEDSSGTTAAPEGTPRPTNLSCSGSDHSIQFDASLQLVDPNVPSSGPHSISLPPGIYDIQVGTWLGFEDYPAHTKEQWYFVTDSGYTSPTTRDTSPTQVVSDTFSGQLISSAVTSITLHHKLPGKPQNNSVHPLCVGFTLVGPVPTTTAAPTTTVAETTTTAAPTTTVAETTTTAAPETTVAETTTTVAETTTTKVVILAESTTTTAAPTTTTKAPVKELALTGPSDLARSLGLVGFALTFAGLAALAAARRSEDY